MVAITAVRRSEVVRSFRVAQVAGLFDLPAEERGAVCVSGEVPGLDERWRIGAIVGPSGSGKSTIAGEAFGPGGRVAPGALVGKFDWPTDGAVVDGFASDLDGRQITGMLNAVGFSSPPAWLRPWGVLSNGEKFRADLARALLLDRQVVAFDEFTSVVDRQVARFGSAAVAKAIRRGRSRCERFVAVTCHYDVLEWLEPDWTLDMASGKLARGSVRRPGVELEIRRCSRGLWGRFRSHHYLSGALSPASRCFAACWEGQPIGFCATIPLMGCVGRRICHRLVVLPDYQGLGVGMALLREVAVRESSKAPMSIVTSHPALIRALNASRQWRTASVNRCGKPQPGHRRKAGGTATGSAGRVTASFHWRG